MREDVQRARDALKGLPDWHDTVLRHWEDTTAYLLGFRKPCIDIRDAELREIRDHRVVVSLDARELTTWKPPKSWFMAVLLCPGDDLKPLLDWIKKRGVDANRIHLYVHRHQDVDEFATAWEEAGHSAYNLDSNINSWHDLHQLLGNHLSIRIYQDAVTHSHHD